MSENFNLNLFLEKAVKSNSSDIHLRVGKRPIVRRDGIILKVDSPVITNEEMDETVNQIIPAYLKDKLYEYTDLDFSYEVKNVARFRVNLSRSLSEYSLVLRVIPYYISSFDKLNLPLSIANFADYNNGIVLITGPTGSGKSTTLAAFIEYINAKYQKHIITIEDPIEYMFTDKKSVITQRQVGSDTRNFVSGIKYALRQDPDVILIGEIRDLETLNVALQAAETGHLVFATLHTNDTVQTVYRIINMYPPEDRDVVKKQISQTLRGIIAQKLVKKANSLGRLPACEIMVITSTIKDLIIKDEVESIYELIKKGSFNDMLTMNESLFNLYKNGDITKEVALEASDNKNELEQKMRGVYHGTEM
ncbi:PilT/PilU family type 4a pilus ATPase [bacterium]|nr:PilT/PilU family type 4a pilus ATPase [bacterium]